MVLGSRETRFCRGFAVADGPDGLPATDTNVYVASRSAGAARSAVGLGGGCLAGSGPKANPATAPSTANAAAASRTSLSPLAVPARAAWATAARPAGGTTAATRVPAPEATAAASRWAAPGGAGRPARACRGAGGARGGYNAPSAGTPVAAAD